MVLHRLVPVAAGCEYVEFDLRLGASSRCLGTGSGGTGGSRARATAARKQQHRDEPTPKRVVRRCLGGLQTEKWEFKYPTPAQVGRLWDTAMLRAHDKLHSHSNDRGPDHEGAVACEQRRSRRRKRIRVEGVGFLDFH